MNCVIISGRLTADPVVRYTSDQMAVAAFNVAVDRMSKEKKADFPKVTVFGRQAENCEKYLSKGSKVLVKGRIQTGKYTNKNGETVYTTDVIAENVEFLDSKSDAKSVKKDDVYEQFSTVDEDMPF